MDFISRDALVAGMNAWVLAKDKPLGEILVNQKALAADRRTLLEALVQEHLKQHGNDAEKSLAAVSSIGEVRGRSSPDRRSGCTGLDGPCARAAAGGRSLCHACPVGRQFHLVGQRVSASSGRMPEGGLGKVSVARDEELQREVALKEIQERHADNPDSRSRFLLEAEITGGLEHPGIVPVYGLGQYADGRPYYAMRFIRGDSLQEAVARFHEQRGQAARFRRAGPGAPRPAGPLHRRLQCHRLRPQPRRAAPRPEAGQHHARPVRRDPGRRLGTGQAPGPVGYEVGIGGRAA